MTTITVKGNEFNVFDKKLSSPRRAIFYKNAIIQNLGKIGVHEEDITVTEEKFVIKKVKASASWYFDGEHMYFSYNRSNFMENIYVVHKVIEAEVSTLLNEEKTHEEFMSDFVEDVKVEEERKKARKLIGVDKDEMDLEVINKKYKALAKIHHPDSSGDTERFKVLNKAHKLLKKELE